MKYILQVFTGSWHAAHDDPGDIIRRIRETASRIPVGKVIIGWNTDPAVYGRVGDFLHAEGIRMLLWLPVFSEINEICKTDRVLDLFGNPVIPPPSQTGEGFAFVCPSSPGNIQAPVDIYEKYFSECGFDGVFLDRIRSQSFAAGVSGVLSCGCGRCRKAFRDRGVDIDAVAKRYEQKKDAFFDMAAFPMNGRFELKDPLAQRFFTEKERIIADAVTFICRYFRNQGMIVGLDLFAPVVSRFVGQDYPRITKYADFIKPMLYRRTEAPAGIGYEYGLFEKNAPKARGRSPLAMDKAFLDTQLDALAANPCEKYPGIEVNRVEGLVDTDPGYIAESLAAVRDRGFEGAALCWNLMQVPDAHIAAAAGMEKEANLP